MKRSLVIVFSSFLFCFSGLSGAFANKEIGEGYATPTFRELTQTIVLLGGVDINDTRIADEYARLVYCDQYQKKFKDELDWHKIRNRIVSRVLEKKEYFRIFYETYGVFKLERYDFEGQFFPFSPETALVKVGSVVLTSVEEYRPYCGLKKSVPVFSPNINLLLHQPLTLDRFRIPVEKVEKMLARMAETKGTERWLYGRIRFRVMATPGVIIVKSKIIRVELQGKVTAVDFFLDREMTRLVGSVRVSSR